jgi:peptide deformylase
VELSLWVEIEMAIRKILQATEPRGEAILRRKSKKVRVFDKDLQRLVDDMVESMREYYGVGLAAPQVGVLQRVIVVELPPEKEDEGEDAPEKPGQLFVMCNPEITDQSEEQVRAEEGCLSLAGLYGEVPRSETVEVRYQDLRGRRRRLYAEGYLARIFQHEIDHLEGVLFTDRVEDLSTLRRLTEEGMEPVVEGLVVVGD